MKYKGYDYEAKPENAEYSCVGCSFIHVVRKIVNVGQKTKPEYKEVDTGQRGCSAPNIEPFRSCKRDHVIYKTTKV